MLFVLVHQGRRNWILRRLSFITNGSEGPRLVFDEGEASIQEAVANYLREIYKDTDYYISLNRYFFARLQNTNHVVIIGWSAGEVDLPYLQIIRNSVQKEARWTVYYYDQAANDSLCKALTDCGIPDDHIDYYQSDSFWDM